MIKNKETELLENSSVRLTITVAEEAVRKEYDGLLAEYCQNVRMDGFRKGKVPPAILLRKYGEIILGETAERVVQKSLEQALEGGEQKPIATSMPTVDAADKLELGKEFSYKVTFDTFPKIELPEYKGLEYEELEVEVGEEDLERELKGLQEQNSVVVDKKDPVAAKGDIVNVDYVELEEGGEEKTATRRQSFVFEVGSGYNLYRFDEEIVGMKAGEEKTIAKDYPADFEVKELAGRKLSLKVKLNSVKEKQLPEINDELAQDISDKYKNLEDLKKDIREKLAKHASRGCGSTASASSWTRSPPRPPSPCPSPCWTASWRRSGSASWGACGPTRRSCCASWRRRGAASRACRRNGNRPRRRSCACSWW